MAYKKEYWVEKHKRAKQAKEHTQVVEYLYEEEIKESVKKNIIYDTDFTSNKENICKTNIQIEDLDSVSAVIKYVNQYKKKTAVLNFSSYKNPGGMFLEGSRAQEECLCHNSYLYNVLSEFQIEFYDWNNSHKNKALYLNRALYSPDIVFVKDEDTVLCDVITCAAPNKSAAQKYQFVSNEQNTEVLTSRIKFVLDIARENKVETLILGAYGCGVFGQDADEVARIFKHYLTTTHSCFQNVVFSIPSGRDKNLEAFKNVFKNIEVGKGVR